MFRANIPVLCYHSVGPIDGHTPGRFREHLDAIEQLGYTPISARRLLDICGGRAKPAGRELVLTFDDCHLSNWLNVIPELVRRKMPGVFFAVTDFIGDGPARSASTAPRIASVPDSFRAALSRNDFSQFMNREEIRAAINDFGMEVYSHSSRHQACFINMRRLPNTKKSHWGCHGIYPRFSGELPVFDTGSAYAYNGFWPGEDGGGLKFRLRTDEERYAFCLEDFRRSLEIMAEIDPEAPRLFCWPWGAFDALSEKALKEAGFEGAFTLERDFNGRGTDPFRINRIGVASKQDGDWIKSRLNLYRPEVQTRVLIKKFRPNPQPKTVLYVTDSTKLSGGSRQLVNNVRAMVEHGVKVVASVPRDSALKAELEAEPIILEDNDGLRDYLPSIRFLRSVIRKHSVDVVHTFHNRAVKMAALARLFGPKCKLFFNRGVVFRPNALAPLWARIGDAYVANSRAGAKVLQRHFVPADRLRVVYNSYSAPPIPRDPGRDLAHTLAGEANVLYLGNEAPAKGFDVFLRMVELLMRSGRDKGLRFTSVGVSPKGMSQFSGFPKRVLEAVRQAGAVPHDQVLEELSRASILVISSRQESMPNALLEGFAAGLPVVGTRAGGVPELISHGINGYLCPLEDANCLARHVRFLADSPGLRERMGRVNRFALDAWFSNRAKGMALLDIYSGGRNTIRLPLGDR